MSTITEGEARRRERAAWKAGWGCFYGEPGNGLDELYPVLTVTRPRVVRDSSGCEWKIDGGDIFIRGRVAQFADRVFGGAPSDTGWERYHGGTASVPSPITDAFIRSVEENTRIIRDLFANPTETVEAP